MVSTKSKIVNHTENRCPLISLWQGFKSACDDRFPTDNLPCHFASAFGAGFVTTCIASPVDVVKTRYMNSPQGQYKSAINCAWTMATKEGPTAFYKG